MEKINFDSAFLIQTHIQNTYFIHITLVEEAVVHQCYANAKKGVFRVRRILTKH